MSARLPRWADLEIFLAVARHGTLAAAGSALGVNASTVQRRIGTLECDLDTRLFERSQKGYALTGPGEELLEHAATMEEAALAAGRRIGGRDQRLEGTVRLTTVDDLAVTLLPPLLARFRQRHPGVTVSVDLGSAFADLTRRQADVALRFGPRPDGDVLARHIGRGHLRLYATRAYLRRHPPIRQLDDLSGHPGVRGTEAHAYLPMETLMQRHGGPVAYRSGSMLARLSAVRAGLGVGLLPCFAADPDRALTRIDLDLPELYGDLWMLIHVDLRRNARVRAFVDLVHEGLVAQRRLLEGRTR